MCAQGSKNNLNHCGHKQYTSIQYNVNIMFTEF